MSKMTVEELKNFRKWIEPTLTPASNFFWVIDTALSLYHENDMLKTLLSESRADNTRLSRYEKAWKIVKKTLEEWEAISISTIRRLEKECGIEEEV